MSVDHVISIPGHPNIYDHNSPRIMKVYLSEPTNGINQDTGFCLLIAGYGGNAESNVYKKMRHVFADKYNLVTVQCNYFGYEFMQGSESVKFDLNVDYYAKFLSTDELLHVFENRTFHPERLFSVAQKYNMDIHSTEVLQESLSNFNDMGLMQALDNLTALLTVMTKVKLQGIKFNAQKVIAYGYSQGAYLAHLCNVFAPKLFSLLIDNSAWLFPNYFTDPRRFDKQFGAMTFHVKFDYLARKLPYDREVLSLPHLYQTFTNQANIVSFQGTDDDLIVPGQKRDFCNQVERCQYVEITPDQVDGLIYKSAGHGLDADFLLLFDSVMGSYPQQIETDYGLPTVHIETNERQYTFIYDIGVPRLVSEEKSINIV